MTPTSAPRAPHAEDCDALDAALRAEGPAAALELLARTLAGRGEFRALLDAQLLRARQELGLPPVVAGGLSDLPEPQRSQYEGRYVAAIRDVGRRLLEAGDVPGAWPYFRALGEPEPVAAAIEAFAPGEGDEDRVGAVVEVAFHGGAHPRRGWELILEHYGTCSAITAFEHLPPDDAVRTACAERLVRVVHGQVVAGLRADIARRGQPMPPEGTPIAGLIDGRDWLFADDAYHVDTSHLASTVRLGPMLADPAAIGLAAELTDYGRRLSPRHRYDGEPPFERTYEDHAVYLRALLGRDVEAAVAHFRAKLPPPPADGPPSPADSVPAQVLVGLLERLGRLDEAIDVAAEHLAGLPESALFCPGPAALCLRAGRPDRLAEIARAHGDLVHYVAARLAAERPAAVAGSRSSR